MKSILITGGAGFVGSHLCKRLLNEGNKVICVDNLSTSHFRNIQDLARKKNFEFIEYDITNPLDLDADEIYNLACPASPIHYQSDPIQTTRTCTVGVINMLELAKKNNAKILQASTSEVYGDPEVHPQLEAYWGNVNPIGIRSCYDEGKRCAESLFFDYHRQHNIDVKVARIFNTYGPNMHPNDGRVVSNFIVQALSNQDITIYGNGLQTRSFQYIDDLINGLVGVMESTYTGPINIGNSDEFTIKELAEIVLDLVPKSTSKIIYKKLPQDDPKQRKPDTALAKEQLKWQPREDLRSGLTKTIRYFENYLSDSNSLA